jgi:hypothetical protein
MPDFVMPVPPEVPADQHGEGTGELRYEDVAQDGRLRVVALPAALAWTLWRPVLARRDGERALSKHGIVPILTRLTVTGTEARVRLDQPATGAGRFELAAREVSGQVDRLYLNMWLSLSGRAGRLFPREGPGEPVVAGHLFAEHVFTRLFAPPGQRSVTSFAAVGHPDLPAVPTARYPGPSATSAGELPAGATWLDDADVADPVVTCFGLDQTDSNQHVNSLVYPRLFIEATQRRLAAHGLSRAVLTRSLDIAFRKPCFAGDQVAVHLRLFRWGDDVGAAGVLRPVGQPDDSPRCFARLVAR